MTATQINPILIADDSEAPTIGRVEASHNYFSPADHIIVQRFEDPKVKNVSCYVGLPDIGGISSLTHMEEIPYHFSIQCAKTGPVEIVEPLPTAQRGEDIVWRVENFWLKILRVTRFYDPEKKVIVYMVWSSHLVKGSTANSISTISLKDK